MCRSRSSRASAAADRRGRAVLVLLATCLLATARPGAAATWTPSLLAVAVNGVDTGQVVAAWSSDDEGLALPWADLVGWRLNVPADAVRQHAGAELVALSRIPGLTWRVDEDRQALAIDGAPSSFAAHKADADALRRAVPVTSAATGSFLNYDVQVQQGGGASRSAAGLLEWGLFKPSGSGTATALVHAGPGGLPAFTRLDTHWTIDDPQGLRSLRLGDAVTRPGSWGRAVRFAGVQWSSNFALQPGFIAHALPSVRGESALPSTLDVYVDNVRRLEMAVPAGPFDVGQVPVLTGQGDMRVVVRDLLGREQTILAPYLVSPRLLRPGLEETSYELGWLRRDYGLRTDRYGPAVLAATHRAGVGEDLTREWRAELSADRQAVGGAATAKWLQGVVTGSLAVSHAAPGEGALVQLDAEQRLGAVNFTGRAAWTSRSFVQLGQGPVADRSTLAVAASLPFAGQAVAIGLAQRAAWSGDATRVGSLTYSTHAGAANLALFAMRDFAGTRATALGVVLSWLADERTTASLDASAQGHGLQAQWQAQRQVGTGEGLGWRAVAGGQGRWLTGATWQGPGATFSAEAAGSDATAAGVRLGARGGIAAAGGELFLARSINGSFAVVQAGGVPDVRVYHDHHEVARTNARGVAIVTGLRPWEPNTIGIEHEDLPLDARVEATETVVAPGGRVGVVLPFNVLAEQGIAFQVVDEQGLPLPAATRLRFGADGQETLVGLEGRAALHPYWPGEPVLAGQGDAACRVALPDRIPAGPLPELGTLVCRRQTRT